MNRRWFWGRILSSIGVLAAVLVLNFILFRIMPGDAVGTIIDPNFSPEAKDRLRGSTDWTSRLNSFSYTSGRCSPSVSASHS